MLEIASGDDVDRDLVLEGGLREDQGVRAADTAEAEEKDVDGHVGELMGQV